MSRTSICYHCGTVHDSNLICDAMLAEHADRMAVPIETARALGRDLAAAQAQIETLIKAEARIAELQRELDALRAFALDVMGDWPDDCGVDGFDLQDFALKHGLLTETKVTAPCSENCWCVEYHGSDPEDWADGVICYKKTPLLLDATREGK